MMSQELCYSKLTDNSIRVLTLLPAANYNDDIICRLEQLKLVDGEAQTYEALSYTWGSDKDKATIYFNHVGESELAVTKNLAISLRHLRLANKERILWIDAICINQQDLDERGHQVKLMAKIYSLACRVVIWIGSASESSTYSLTLLRDLASRVSVDWFHRSMVPSTSSVHEPHWADGNHGLPFTDEDYVKLSHLLDRPWFHRLWILQEIRLANQSAIFVCGYENIPVTAMKDALFCIREKRIKTPNVPQWSSVLNRAFMIIDYDGMFTLPSLMHRARSAKCTDDRDRIYAMLSMFSNCQHGHSNYPLRLNLEPDYRQTTQQVWADFFMKVVENTSRLDLLVLCAAQDNAELPTWVPNFANLKEAENLNNPRAVGEFSSARVVFRGGDVLQAGGIRLGRVNIVDDIRQVSLDSDICVIEAARKFAQSHDVTSLYVDGHPLLEVYCRTLCLNRTADYWDPPSLVSLPDIASALPFVQGALQANDNAPLTLDGSSRRFLDYAKDSSDDRVFIEIADGLIGFGPPSTRPDDQICVLLGCDSPLVIRPVQKGINRYQVVGECFIAGLMRGEAIFGQLPSAIRRISQYAGNNIWQGVYHDSTTGISHTEDPRLKKIPPEYRHFFANEMSGIELSRLPTSEASMIFGKLGVAYEDIEFV